MSPARLLLVLRLACAWSAFLGLLPAAAADVPAALGPRHHEAAGGFSFCPPRGWAMRTIPGSPYQYAIYIADGFTPLMSVVDDKTGDSLADYIRSSIEGIKGFFPDYAEVGITRLTTSSGLTAERRIVTLTQKGKPLRQSLFFVDGGNGAKYLIKGSALASDGDARDAGFLAAARSFQLDAPASAAGGAAAGPPPHGTTP